MGPAVQSSCSHGSNATWVVNDVIFPVVSVAAENENVVLKQQIVFCLELFPHDISCSEAITHHMITHFGKHLQIIEVTSPTTSISHTPSAMDS